MIHRATKAISAKAAVTQIGLRISPFDVMFVALSLVLRQHEIHCEFMCYLRFTSNTRKRAPMLATKYGEKAYGSYTLAHGSFQHPQAGAYVGY